MNNILNPYVLGCKAPILENDSIPTSVSLMNVNCSDEAPSNNILINYVDRCLTVIYRLLEFNVYFLQKSNIKKWHCYLLKKS